MHPQEQKNALEGLLEEVGLANAVLGRELPDGRVMLIDGHLRKDLTGSQSIPVLIIDVDDKEADLILATHDPVAAMAKADPEKVESLLKDITTGSPSIAELLASLAAQSQIEIPEKSHKRPGGADWTDPSEIHRDLKTIIQYTITFDSEEDKDDWYKLVSWLAKQYPDLETVGERLALHARLITEDIDDGTAEKSSGDPE